MAQVNIKTIDFGKKSFCVLFICLAFYLNGQDKQTILIPTKQYANSPDAIPDISDVIEATSEFLKLHSSISCIQKINPKLDSCIAVEMKKLKSEKKYILSVDYFDCKFISLIPDAGDGIIKNQKSTTYYITLYPDITSHPNFPSIKKVESSSSKTPILATFQNENGKWIAMGPYMTTDPYDTETRAIGALFYTDKDLNFLCQRGKFKIYKLNEKLEHDARDIRGALMQLGINDIPE